MIMALVFLPTCVSGEVDLEARMEGGGGGGRPNADARSLCAPASTIGCMLACSMAASFLSLSPAMNEDERCLREVAVWGVLA